MKNWFINKRRLETFTPSVAEVRINNILTNLGYDFEQEVSFKRCRSSRNGFLIFDFIVPKLRVLIEYDGYHHETSINTMENDIIKTKFAKDYGYKLFRFNKKNWATLDKDIEAKLSGYKPEKIINKKPFHMVNNTRKGKARRALSKIAITIDDYNRFYKS